MEATGRDGKSYHYHEEEEIHDNSREQSTGSSSHTVSSSRSGTIVSTASTSSGCRLSSVSMSMSMSTETAMHFDFDLDGENKEQIKQITSLVQEFSFPAGAGNMSVLERWFAELGVTWVLHLGDGASAAAMLAHAFDNASSWIRALAKITETISLMVNPKTISLMGSLCSDSDCGSVALPSICEEEPETANGKEEARTGFLKLLIEDEDGDNSSSSGTPTWQGSSDIHMVSRHVMGYVTFIQHHYRALHTVVSKAALDSLQMEMVSCLQENLASKSELFLDQSLRFLFLINNLYFILGNLTSDSCFLTYPFNSIDVATIRKPDCIELVATLRLLSGYLESYIQVSWAPLLACRSQLSKFGPQFQKIYSTQKQWKVPDPMMGGMLREEITRRIIPGHPKYVMDNKATTPKISPWWDMEHMMQQLFEG